MSKKDELLAEGSAALKKWLADPNQCTPAQLQDAVRWTLELLRQDLPGRAVEVRVPPAGAVQILGGTTHRRGTPPAVIETDMQTWLELATGKISWQQAQQSGNIDASGQRADLEQYLPLQLN